MWLSFLLACAGESAAPVPAAAPREDLDCGDGAARVWYPDADGDGFGGQDGGVVACDAPDGTTADFRDCDDTDAGVFPGVADDFCDDVDDDCDGDVDEDAPEAITLYADADGDGHGDPSSEMTGCHPREGVVESADDCDDDSADARPGGTEVCGDGLDGDCDGVTDPGCGGQVEADLTLLPSLVGDDLDSVVFTNNHSAHIALATGGDTDGDGAPELVIGVPGAGPEDASSAGRVYVVEGLPTAEATFAEAGARVAGDTARAYAGSSVAFLRDSDGDGADELLVGANGAGGIYQGAVYVLAAPWETPSLTDASAVLVGTDGSEYAGTTVVDAGTALGGPAAVAIGAPGYDEDRGAVYLVAAPFVGEIDLADADAMLVGDGTLTCAGAALANPGDLDGDGFDDLLVGPGDGGTGWYEAKDGAAWIVHGPLSGTLDLADADTRIGGDGTMGGVGFAVVGPGDVDGDGLPDVAVSAITLELASGGTGGVFVYTGAPLGSLGLDDATTRLEATKHDPEAGSDLDPAGDVDGDGRADLLVGSGTFDGDVYAHAVYVVTGLGPGTFALDEAAAIAWTGIWQNVVAGGADLDGDGGPDVFVGGVGSTELWPIGYHGVVYAASTGGWF